MRRPCRFGYIIAGVGVVIILAVLLPGVFWWLFFGAALVLIGVLICRH
jgi:hypothetical protein